MKKQIMLILSSAILSVSLVGCGHEHVFSEATCTEPARCAEDNVTEGEPLGHDFSEATCAEPATCKRCGETEGDVLEHDFKEATCGEAKTCKVCGVTEGNPTGEHDFEPANFETPKTCKVCGITEGNKVSVNVIDTNFKQSDNVYMLNNDRFVKKDGWNFTIVDAKNNVIKCFEPDLPNKMSHSVTDEYIVTMGNTSRGVLVYVYDCDGEMMCACEFDKTENSMIPDFKSDWTLAECWDTEIEIYNIQSGYIIGCVLPDVADYITTMEGIEVYIDDRKKPDFGDDIYVDRYSEAINGYLACWKLGSDDEEWGYVDENGTEIARYLDACDYNDAGYALATNDRESYFIIDAQQNVVAEKFIEGKVAALLNKGYIRVTKPDDTVAFVSIE